MMEVLVAEDNATSRLVLESVVKKWGFSVVSTQNGNEAWSALQKESAPKLVVLDWMMPGMTGVEICQKVRAQETDEPAFIILLTSRDAKDDIVVGLEAGANDYVTKPFDKNELRARLHVGKHIIELQSSLASKVRELRKAAQEIRTLRGIVTICMHCHRMLSDDESWDRLEEYIEEHSDAKFSHGICPDCRKEHYPECDVKPRGLPSGT